MISPRSVMAVLAVLALSAKVAESDIAAPSLCGDADVDVGFCFNCKSKAKCVAAGNGPVSAGDCTVPGEACTVLAGIASCRPIDETACSCDKTAQCDAYDPLAILYCFDEGTSIALCTTPQTCDDGKCTVLVDPCSGIGNDFIVIPPMCTAGILCDGTGSSVGTTNCESGFYFDVAQTNCMPLPPVPCADCNTGSCPDKTDCSKYYICQGGVALDEETCDGSTPVFDITSNACVAIGAETCTGNANCEFDLTVASETTTTTVTSSDGSSTADSTASGTGSTSDSTTTTSRPAECTAANVGTHYPFEADCKMYVTCVQISEGNYDYVTSTCLGDLVFNADIGYCDTPDHVPDCITTSQVF